MAVLNPAQPAPQIEIADYRVVVQPGDRWQLSICWRISNRADQPLYLLLAQPLATTIAEPLVLDHAAHTPALPIDSNADLSFSIVTIGPRDVLEHRMEYALTLPESTHALRIVGRFGYSLVAPDPGWEQGRNWQQIERWQQIVESQPVVVAPQP